MTSTGVTPSSEVIESWKEETWSYSIYTLAYILMMQNIGPNQEKPKLSQISPATNLLKGLILIKGWRLLMIK